MLNNSGQIAPDAAVFDGGKQKAPVLTVKIDDHHSLTGPLYVQPGLSDYTLIASLGMGRTVSVELALIWVTKLLLFAFTR